LSKEVDNSPAAATTESANPNEQSKDDGIHPDLFDENFKELKKWVDVKCTKYGILLVTHEKRSQRIGTALKVFSFSKSCYVTESFVPFLFYSFFSFLKVFLL
jgi:tripeptidyl-peptidase II